MTTNTSEQTTIEYAGGAYLRSIVKEPETVYDLYIDDFPYQVLPNQFELAKNLKLLRIEDSYNLDWRNAEEIFNRLESLTYLGFISNNFTALPFDPEKLNKLETLRLQSTPNVNIEEVIDKASKLPHLKLLRLYDVPYSELPPSTTKLIELEEIQIGLSQNLNFEQHFEILKQLPSLKTLTILAIDDDITADFSQLDIENIHIIRCPNLDYERIFSQLKKLKEVEISADKNLKELPTSLLKHKEITSLILNENRNINFDALNNSIAAFKSLEKISLDRSDPSLLDKPEKAKHLPLSLKELKSLRAIDLSYQQYLELPEIIEILNALNIQSLSLNLISSFETGDQFYKLPSDFQDIKSLNHLSINNSGTETFDNLSYLPDNIVSLSKAESGMETIPELILNHSKLKSLDLSDNDILEVQESIKNLKNLEHLNLSKNKLTTLPEAIKELHHLKFLQLEKNPLCEDESEIERIKALLPNTTISFYE